VRRRHSPRHSGSQATPREFLIETLDSVEYSRLVIVPIVTVKAIHVKHTVAAVARSRAEELTEWLRVNAPECSLEQKHLDEGTAERTYWHYGYLSALRDILAFLSSDN
jgi:hypothetical protein